MLRITSVLFFLAALFMGAGVAAKKTQLLDMWHEPTADFSKLKKVLVAFPGLDKGKRLSAEVRLMQRIPGGATSTSVFLNGEDGNVERMKQTVVAKGFDAVVILRLLEVGVETDYRPPSVTTYATTAPDMYGFWGEGYATVYDPGYKKDYIDYVIETQIFTVADGKLVWITRSATLNPDDVVKGIDSVIDANADAMRKAGLIKGKKR